MFELSASRSALRRAALGEGSDVHAMMDEAGKQFSGRWTNSDVLEYSIQATISILNGILVHSVAEMLLFCSLRITTSMPHLLMGLLPKTVF
jgi:enoyl-CoA hydratase/carnithine racemase